MSNELLGSWRERSLSAHIIPTPAMLQAAIGGFYNRTAKGEGMGLLFGGSGANLSGGTDWGSIIGGIGAAVTDIYRTKAQTKLLRSMSSGARRPMAMPQYPGVPAAAPWPSLAPTTGGGPFQDVSWTDDVLSGGLPGIAEWAFGNMLAPGGGGSAVAARSGRPPALVGAWDQNTQRGAFYRYVGKPVLFSGDLTHLKRTRKVIRRFASPAGLSAGRGSLRRRRRC